jgi:Protein of unknown function (DUF3237)
MGDLAEDHGYFPGRGLRIRVSPSSHRRYRTLREALDRYAHGVAHPTDIATEFLFTLTARVGAPFDVGELSGGRRRISPIEGGEFEGPRLRGRVLPVTGDWMLIRPDGVTVIDVRATLQTDDDALIYMRYGGFRHGPKDVMEALARGEAVDPSTYYFRITATVETGAEGYSWLNQIATIGTGRRDPSGPVYDVYEVL